jgi:UDP-glucuronate 4-epimerase
LSTFGSKPILITGAAGFIGFHLAHRLLQEGVEVVGVDSLNDYYEVSLKHARLNHLKAFPNFRFYHMNLANLKDVESLFHEESVDYIVHLAAQAGVRYSLENPQAYTEANITSFINLIDTARKHQVKHFLYASSSSVYGANTLKPFSVKHNVDHPVSLYAATKKANELMAHTYACNFQLPVTGLRFFTVYGPWGRPDMALFKFVKAISKGEPIEVYNNGNMRRDFTYVDDVVEGLYRLITHIPTPDPKWNSDHPNPSTSFAPYRIYNIGNNSPVNLMDFIAAIEKALKKKAKIEFMPIQKGDVPETYANVDALMKDVGYKPETPIEKGIAEFVSWYKSYYHA